MLGRTLAIMLTMILCVGCSSAPQSEPTAVSADPVAGQPWDLMFTGEVTTRAVFDQDDRELMPVDEYPWSAVGRLDMGDSHCTASLIGPDLILTNAHCVLAGLDGSERPSIRLPQTLSFYPAFRPDRAPMYSAGQRVWLDDLVFDRQLITNPVGAYADWAIIRLRQPLGERYGWIEPAQAAATGVVSLGGYSGDYEQGRQALLHRDCQIRIQKDDESVLHDCDMTAGASGSPLVMFDGERALIAALNSAEYGEHVRDARFAGRLQFSEDTHNVAVSSQTFFSQLEHIPPIPEGRRDYYLTFCNDLGSPVEMTLAHYDDEPLLSFGPIPVEQGSCAEIHMGNRPDRDFFIALEGRRMTSVGDQAICVHPGHSLLTELGDDCRDAPTQRRFTELPQPDPGYPVMLSSVPMDARTADDRPAGQGRKGKPARPPAGDYGGERTGPNVVR